MGPTILLVSLVLAIILTVAYPGQPGLIRALAVLAVGDGILFVIYIVLRLRRRIR